MFRYKIPKYTDLVLVSAEDPRVTEFQTKINIAVTVTTPALVPVSFFGRDFQKNAGSDYEEAVENSLHEYGYLEEGSYRDLNLYSDYRQCVINVSLSSHDPQKAFAGLKEALGYTEGSWFGDVIASPIDLEALGYSPAEATDMVIQAIWYLCYHRYILHKVVLIVSPEMVERANGAIKQLLEKPLEPIFMVTICHFCLTSVKPQPGHPITYCNNHRHKNHTNCLIANANNDGGRYCFVCFDTNLFDEPSHGAALI